MREKRKKEKFNIFGGGDCKMHAIANVIAQAKIKYPFPMINVKDQCRMLTRRHHWSSENETSNHPIIFIKHVKCKQGGIIDQVKMKHSITHYLSKNIYAGYIGS